MKYQVDYHDGYFEITTHGDAEVGGFKEFIELLLAHEKWNPGTAFLVDHSGVNSGPLTVDEIRYIADMSVKPRVQFGRARCALLVARKLEYGPARMWEVFVDGKWDVTERVFWSRDKAISWLKDV